mmetsp:Transcript_14397/g.31200  ORF Transcript_14397/g.31200 Transcript_14397/m.31200 type:complete len:353 (-) Transcript_14397:2169-3227(-)
MRKMAFDQEEYERIELTPWHFPPIKKKHLVGLGPSDESTYHWHWRCVTPLFITILALLIVVGVYTLGLEEGKSVARKYAIPTIDVKQQQILNYQIGTALILNIHITHHGGTSVCALMRKFGDSPDFACMGRGKEGDWPADEPETWSKHYRLYNETASFVTSFRQHFHFVSWEYVTWANLHGINWEHDDLVSMIVMRDPLERFLAGGKCGGFQPQLPGGDPTNETQDVYWEYASAECADNYALRVLAEQKDCAQGSNTSIACLEGAKNLLRRFTFILDQACLSESMIALGRVLHLNITEQKFEHKGLHKDHTLSPRERIGNDTLYEFVGHKFRRDIELYEWSKAHSIVKCGSR